MRFSLTLAVLSFVGAAAAFSCPAGTAFDRGLCVSPAHPAAQNVAAALRETFFGGSLAALVAGVWHKGQPVAVGGLGDSLPGLPANPDMRHICGNVGSSLLTALYLKLAEEGVLGIDDPVAKFVPSLGIPKADKITLRMLASGTSGIEHFPGMDSFQKAFYQNPFRTWDPRELVGYGISVPLLFEPGTNWHFSDTNLVILGLCIESATGQKVQDLITARWLRPLNMTSSYMPWNPSIPDPVLHSYTSERGVYEEATFWNPQWISFPGHLICQQDDVRTWMEALNGGRVLSPASLKTLLSYPGFGFGPNPQKYYGMGTGVWSNWTFTNPSLQGLRGAVGRHEQGDATVVIFNTVSPASDQEAHQATPAFVKVAEALGLPVWMP